VIADKHIEHGSCVERKRQSSGDGRPVRVNAYKFLMVVISPCQMGQTVSSFVPATMSDRSDLRRMAAPKILFPDSTPRPRQRNDVLFHDVEQA